MSEALDASYQRAALLVDMGRTRDAEQMLRSLLAAEPGNLSVILLLAAVLHDEDRYDQAHELAARAVALAPDSAHAHRELADALRGLRRHDEAVAAAREAVRLDPLDWRTHLHLGLALREGRRPRHRDALECANQAIRLAPHTAAAHNLAGMCLDDLGQGETALAAYTEALRLDPGNASVLNNIAVLRANSGKLREASTFLTAGLSADAQEKILHQNYDFILFKLMRRLFWSELGFAILIAILAGAGAPWYARAVAGLAMVALFAAITRGILANLPRGAERHALGLFRRTRGWMRYAVALFVVTSIAVLAMAFTPRALALGIGLGMLGLFRVLGIIVIVTAIVGGLVNVVRGAQKR